jgi:hypothetical protein
MIINDGLGMVSNRAVVACFNAELTGGLNKIAEVISQDSVFPGTVSNLGPSEHERVLAIDP